VTLQNAALRDAVQHNTACFTLRYPEVADLALFFDAVSAVVMVHVNAGA
jgi:hypothetical protein